MVDAGHPVEAPSLNVVLVDFDTDTSGAAHA